MGCGRSAPEADVPDEGRQVIVETLAGFLREAVEIELRVNETRGNLLWNQKSNLRSAFALLDHDNKGYLTAEDFATYLSVLRPAVKRWDVLMMIRGVFGPHVKQIDFPSFANWVMYRHNLTGHKFAVMKEVPEDQKAVDTWLGGRSPEATGDSGAPKEGEGTGKDTGGAGQTVTLPPFSEVEQAALADFLALQTQGHKRIQRYNAILHRYKLHKYTPDELFRFISEELGEKEEQEDKEANRHKHVEDFHISPETLVEFFKKNNIQAPTRTDEWAKLAIARFDRDFDGQLSSDEFAAALRLDPEESSTLVALHKRDGCSDCGVAGGTMQIIRSPQGAHMPPVEIPVTPQMPMQTSVLARPTTYAFSTGVPQGTSPNTLRPETQAGSATESGTAQNALAQAANGTS
uniref:EF-hand domain-containing protein n=1 Tax=Chromera velia CCMP2878 TaxID=1169474 RepID=A0A0G4HGZ7_9ALVE|eukprot:Cvel_6811.t1-p1 / transcript=Cvel_6811.t1 / gene=Cvel_6811 / organism=Chromera_velia_CCMP2878 / gene_product=hypothetical protein / transcript_product=hypothetical protein / location=Cvel_scaffold343:34030-36680(+) / protein_length=403 / sequence_SO=supercontig / SO=protein_coding / is_pseudo=false